MYVANVLGKRIKKWYGDRQKKEEFIPPFQHRENLLNLLVLSDLFIFLSTVAWMEFSQSIFTENGNPLNVLYQISPLSLFTHNCDSYYTYIWILLFNLSTLIAISIIALCIYAVHQTSFEPAYILFLVLTMLAFITVSTFPIIAFISFFKLSIFVLASLVQSNMNLIPAVFSKNVHFPVHDNLNNPHSDIFYQELYQFLYQTTNNKCNISNFLNFDWNVILTLFTTSLIPIFAVVDCEVLQSPKRMKWKRKNKTCAMPHQQNNNLKKDNEFQLRVGIANKVLAQHYSASFWIPFHSKYVTEKLLKTSYSECTTQFIHRLRGYTIGNIISSIRQSFKWEFTMWYREISDHNNTYMSFYDKVLEVQYMIVLFVFIPLQTIFILYGIVYPYIVCFQIMNDLFTYYSTEILDTNVIQNEVMKLLVTSIRHCESISDTLYLLTDYWYFNLFAISLIGHFVAMHVIIYKMWNLRRVFEMCLNIMIIQDSSILTQALIHKMQKLRINIHATKIRNQKLNDLFGRYHLDKLIIEYLGDMHDCQEIFD